MSLLFFGLKHSILRDRKVCEDLESHKKRVRLRKLMKLTRLTRSLPEVI